MNIINDIVYTGIESVVYDEPIQASNTTITDNPSYGVNERRNQSNKITDDHYMILCTGIGSVPLLYEEMMTNRVT